MTIICPGCLVRWCKIGFFWIFFLSHIFTFLFVYWWMLTQLTRFYSTLLNDFYSTLLNFLCWRETFPILWYPYVLSIHPSFTLIVSILPLFFYGLMQTILEDGSKVKCILDGKYSIDIDNDLNFPFTIYIPFRSDAFFYRHV